MRPTEFMMEPYVADGNLSWPTVVYVAFGSALLLAMTSFAIRILLSNRRKGGSV